MTANKIKREFSNIGLFKVKEQDLPICCPLPEMEIWNAHPRVYLPIEATGKIKCPYCSAEYILQK